MMFSHGWREAKSRWSSLEKWIAGSERIRLLQSTDFPFFGRLILPVAGRLLRLLPRRSDVVAMLAGQ